jgi:SAM-dependent methyltransferase
MVLQHWHQQMDPTNPYLLSETMATFPDHGAPPTAHRTRPSDAANPDPADAFVNGRGLPYSAYHGTDDATIDQTRAAAPDGLVLPLLPGLRGQLDHGIDVLDIGCSSGRALLDLAQQFAASRFTGYDLSEDAITRARMDTRWAGLRNVRFEQHDVVGLTDRDAYDLVFAFDDLHAHARPTRVLGNVYRALKPGGLLVLRDAKAPSHDPANPSINPRLHTPSSLRGVPVSLAHGGPDTDAPRGRWKILQLLSDAGFRNVTLTELPQDVASDYYLVRKR